jgi:uncharacterized membrane protein YeaQ/YmgE (transglycosylase-associated protein family)
MEGPEIVALFEAWANTILVWVGFGTIVGLLAKGIMPGRDPGGAVANLAMGIGGTVIGCATLSYFWSGAHVTPISLPGLGVSTAGAFILLAFYRLLRGRIFVEGETGNYHALRGPNYLRGRYRRPIHDDH